MKDSMMSFLCGVVVGVLAVVLIIARTSDERYAIIIKAHQDGRIACNSVGDDFICREVRK